jgi:glycopeptide antibiotics resistance protein
VYDTILLMRKRVKRFCMGLFFTYLFTLIYVTLFTYNYYVYGKSFNLVFFDSIRLMFDSGDPWLFAKNVLGNVVLFFPFGFLLPIVYKPMRFFRSCLAISFSTSLFIELCQYQFAERIFDVDDIFLNTVGAMLGWMIFRLFHRIYALVFPQIRK